MEDVCRFVYADVITIHIHIYTYTHTYTSTHTYMNINTHMKQARDSAAPFGLICFLRHNLISHPQARNASMLLLPHEAHDAVSCGNEGAAPFSNARSHIYICFGNAGRYHDIYSLISV